ncbi:MAG: DUF1161 domain-containing protein [Undibacterium sp.]|nr:DUF1161 domain-containing protein [Undibacterium sp.]
MKQIVLGCSLMGLVFSASASGLSCDDLKVSIEKKLEAKGVKNYSLNIVGKDSESKNRVVGTCEAGSKKIIYERAKAKEAAEKTS